MNQIYLMYALRAVRNFIVIMPIIVPFFEHNGLGMFEIFTLQAVFGLIMLLFEIPSGYAADYWGRKPSLVLGCAISVVGMSIYAFSYSFLGFLIGEILLGIGSAFTSGAYTAFLYDTLKAKGEEASFSARQGIMGAWANYAEATASIIGGALAAISLRTPFYAEIGISTIALALALLLREPERTVYEGENHWEQIRDIVKYSLHGHAELKWLILYTSFIGAGTMTSWWFMQAYFDTVGLPIIWFGVTWAVINASVGVFSTNAHRFESLLGRKQSLINLVIILVVAYILVAQYTTVYGIGLLTLFALVRGFNTPIIRDYTNALVTSDIRATVMSVESMTSRLAFILTGPILGWVHDTWSLTTAFTTAAICYGCLGTVSLAFLHWNDAL